MAYELRFRGTTELFKTANEAKARARAIIQENADATIEIIDLATGRPYALAASPADREALARKIGF